MWALGGFVPEDESVDEFFKSSPPYKTSFGPPRVQVNARSRAKQENIHRLGLVDRANDFLAAMREARCSVRQACKVSGLNRTAADSLRARVPEFDQLWREIFAGVTDELEQAALKRAIDGVERDVYHRGEVCGHEVVYSDSLLAMLLQGRRPETYKQRVSNELTGDPSKPVRHEVVDRTLSRDELMAELKSRGLPTRLLED